LRPPANLLTNLAKETLYLVLSISGALFAQPRAEYENKETIMLKKSFGILVLLGMFASMAACNTVHGLGQDIERGGEKTQDAADAVKKKL
jgi:entericidin B